MNFFSHAFIASQHSSNPRWILGSMLPDFFGMAGLKLEKVIDDQALAGGIKFHHITDDAFHGNAVVEDLMGSATRELLGQGMVKGAAMAIGHVGVELLLDGALVSSVAALKSYREAINELQTTESCLRFCGLDINEGANRWRRITEFMPTASIPESYADPGFVADRLIRILANRPFLAVPGASEELVFSWARKAAPLIEEKASAVFNLVEKSLAGVETADTAY